MRQRHPERQAIVACRQRLQIGADLIRHIALPRHPISADNANIHQPMLHQMPAGIIRHHGMRHAMRAQFKGGQGRALVARPGLIHPDMHIQPGIKGLINRAERRAEIHRCQPAGIAMGQHIHPALRRGNLGQQRQTMLADQPAGLGIIIGNRCRLGIGQRRALALRHRRQHRHHPLQRPAQIDRRRPGLAQHRRYGMQLPRCRAHGQRQAIGRHRADQRRAAHLHGANGMRRLLGRLQTKLLDPPGQHGLVENPHAPAIGIEPDAAIGLTVDLHADALLLGASPAPAPRYNAFPQARAGPLKCADATHKSG